MNNMKTLSGGVIKAGKNCRESNGYWHSKLLFKEEHLEISTNFWSA